jgi:hypothetical protein
MNGEEFFYWNTEKDKKEKKAGAMQSYDRELQRQRCKQLQRHV